MDKKGKFEISKELEQFYCSVLLDEVKEKVRKLKAYGVEEAEIMAAMNEEELFPQLIVTEDYKVVLSGKQPVEGRYGTIGESCLSFVPFAPRRYCIEMLT